MSVTNSNHHLGEMHAPRSSSRSSHLSRPRLESSSFTGVRLLSCPYVPMIVIAFLCPTLVRPFNLDSSGHGLLLFICDPLGFTTAVSDQFNCLTFPNDIWLCHSSCGAPSIGFQASTFFVNLCPKPSRSGMRSTYFPWSSICDSGFIGAWGSSSSWWGRGFDVSEMSPQPGASYGSSRQFYSMVSGMCPKPCQWLFAENHVPQRLSFGSRDSGFISRNDQVPATSLHVNFTLMASGMFNLGLRMRCSRRRPHRVSNWCDSVSTLCIFMGDVSGFHSHVQTVVLRSIGSHPSIFPELFLPRAQQQLPTSFCVPHLEGNKDVLIPHLVPHINKFTCGPRGSMYSEMRP